MIKEQMVDITGESRRNINSFYKLETALAWIRCTQKGKSPIDRLREKQIRRIVVYGITELGELLVEEAGAKGYEILGITDKTVRVGGYEYQGIPIIRRTDIAKYTDEVIVVTAMTFWNEIRNELCAEGCKYVIALRELM